MSFSNESSGVPRLRWVRVRAIPIACFLGALMLAGCASGPNRNPQDPLEPLNRQVSKFNDAVDSAVLKPVATTYQNVTPAVVRTGVSNFFSNLRDFWSFFNNVAQLRPGYAVDNLVRFGVNSTIGLLGVLDVASEMNIERHKADFGQTLGRWGVPAGPYVVLPLLGPSTLRDTMAMTIDTHGDLVRQTEDVPLRNTLYALRIVDVRSNLLRAGKVLDEASLDKYSFTRDVFLQLRRSSIYDGDEPDVDESKSK